MRKSPCELAQRILEAHGHEAVHEAECLATLHRGFGGESFYADVLREVRRLVLQCRLQHLFTAGYVMRGLAD